MVNVTAKIKIKGTTYEILVDLDKALALKKGKASVNEALVNEVIFYNIKSGEHASKDDLNANFGTNDVYKVAEKIIKSGEIEIPSEYKNAEREGKEKQIIDFLVRNAVDPRTGRPYTPGKIQESLSQSGINIENKPVEQQIIKIMEKLKTIIPIKIETKKVKITIPSIHTGRAYGLIQDYKEKEEWLNNGDLKVIINIPVGLQMDFYDKLNSITHGSSVAEEMKSNF